MRNFIITPLFIFSSLLARGVYIHFEIRKPEVLEKKKTAIVVSMR